MAQNPLYNLLRGNTQQGQLNGILGQLQRFKQQFSGDPKQQIQQMLNSGRITQEQYNQAVEMTNKLIQMLT